MATKKNIPSLESLKTIKSQPKNAEQVNTPGQNAVSKARSSAASKKKKMVGVQCSEVELEIIEPILATLRKHDFQSSNANAFRIALRCFSANEKEVKKVIDQLKSEDGRSQR